MLSREQNEMLTRTGPGTPGGALLRRYWQPIALSRELPPGGDPVPVDLLGEELVLFRDPDGRLGLLDRHCCHRGTDLSFGRVEDGGLRCLYHGWLYDVDGKCLEQPGEPAGSAYKDKVRQTAYPVAERAGAFFAYLGPAPAPEFPNYDFFAAPAAHVLAQKIHVSCNYLQANEGNYDPAHVGFLHRNMRRDRAGLMFGEFAAGEAKDAAAVNPYAAPRIEVEETAFGLRLYQIRAAGAGKTYLRVTVFGMPNFSVIAGPQGGEGQIGIWHVPIDDETHWRWGFILRRDTTIAAVLAAGAKDAPAFREGPASEYEDAFHHARKRTNRYGQDRSRMGETFAGMGPVFGVHDAFATESQGAIQDRTKEHLATTDTAIIAARRLMLAAVEEVAAGRDPLGVVRDPAKNAFPDLLSFDALVDDGADHADVVRRMASSTRLAAE
jgi:phthalate 4,5-dioxygenase